MQNKKKEEEIVKKGHYKKVTHIHDDKGKLIHKIISPLVVEFRLRDMLQIMIGATILAVPVGFTEETWRLGEHLPLINIIVLLIVSNLIISVFVYFNYYHHHKHVKHHLNTYLKRTVMTYFLSFLVVAFFLTVIQRAPWAVDSLLAFKRVVLVTFPASMSATVADFLK